MMYKKTYIALFFACLFAGTLHSQTSNGKGFTAIRKEEAAVLLQQVNHKYSSIPSYSFAIIYATYAGYTAPAPYDKKSGYFKKFPDGFHSLIAGVHNLQNKNYFISIDSAKKILMVGKPKKSTESWENPTQEYIKGLNKCSAIKMQQGDKIKTLRIEFDKKAPIAAYELCIDKNMQLQSVLIFYNREVPAQKLGNKAVKPKLSLVFENYTWKNISEKDELNEGKYFAMNNNVITLKEAYKNYTLFDQRIRNEKP